MITSFFLSRCVFELDSGLGVEYENRQSVLNHIRRCGVLLASNDLLREYDAAIARWPNQAQILARKALFNLYKSNRIVREQAQGDVDPCSVSRGVHSIQLRNGVCLWSEKCLACKLKEVNHEAELVVSAPGCADALHGIEEAAASTVIPRGAYTKDEFANRWLRPMLRYTSSLLVVDRYIGRSVLEGSFGRFASSLQWLGEVFVNESATASEVSMICGVQEHKLASCGEAERIDFVRRLEDFAQSLSGRIGIAVNMDVMLESGSMELPHARYLRTGQGYYLFDSGFDLIMNARVKDVVIARISGEPKQVAELFDPAIAKSISARTWDGKLPSGVRTMPTPRR